MLEIYEKLLKQVDNRARFLSGVLSGDIKCINRKKIELRKEFMEKGFDPRPKEVNRRSPDVDTSDYDYLTSMSVSSLTEEYLQHLLELKKRFEIKVGLLRKATPQFLNSEKEPALLDTNYKRAQSDRDDMVDMAAKDSKVFEAAPRRQHKRTAAETLEASVVLMEDEEEDQAPELNYQSQEHTGKKRSAQQERKKQRKRRKKQSKESSERGAPKHSCRALDFRGQDKSGDGFLVEEIKRISCGLDGIEITHCHRDQSMVAPELANLSLRDASVSLRHDGVV